MITDPLAMSRIEEWLASLQAQVDALRALPPPGGGWGALSAGDLDDNTGVVDSETAGVGAATKAKRSDAKDGLKLVGSPGDATEAVASGNFNPSLEFVKDDAAPVVRRGLRVKVNKTDSPSDLRTLEVQAGGLGVKVSATPGNQILVDNGVFCQPKLDDLAAPDDNTDLNVSTTKHGLTPKAPNDATKFLDGTGAWDTVKDADLSTSDVTTNDVSTTKHGFAPKAPNDTTKFLRGDGSWAVPASGGLTVDQEALGSSGSTASNPIIDNIELGADGNYLVWVQVKVSGNTGVCRAYLQYVEDMTTYTVCELHDYCSDGTEGQTLSGVCLLSGWDNDRRLVLTVECGSGSMTVEATETFVLWAKY